MTEWLLRPCMAIDMNPYIAGNRMIPEVLTEPTYYIR